MQVLSFHVSATLNPVTVSILAYFLKKRKKYNYK